MTGLIMKIIISPLVVYLTSLAFPRLVHYPAISQPIAIGLILALAGHVIELFLLKKGTVWFSTAVDLVAATLILYALSPLFPWSRITLGGAIITSLILAVTEHLQHVYLVKAEKTVKS